MCSAAFASAGSVQAVQSLPDLLPVGAAGQHQQQQDLVSPSGISLHKIKSLPAHYHSPQQAQVAADGQPVARSTSHSPVHSSLTMAAAGAGVGAGASHSSSKSVLASWSPAGAGLQDGASPAAGSSWGQQQISGSAAVSQCLRQQLLAASGRVGVVHLALHATEAGLVAGWQQQLAAMVEPGRLFAAAEAASHCGLGWHVWPRAGAYSRPAVLHHEICRVPVCL